MDQARIVRVIVTDDEAVLLLKPDPELRFVMGRFTPARYDESRFGYLLHVGHREALETFARVHGLTIVDGAPTPEDRAPRGRPLPGRFVAPPPLTPAQELARAATYRRGVAMARIRLAQAKLVAQRERMARRNAQP